MTTKRASYIRPYRFTLSLSEMRHTLRYLAVYLFGSEPNR